MNFSNKAGSVQLKNKSSRPYAVMSVPIMGAHHYCASTGKPACCELPQLDRKQKDSEGFWNSCALEREREAQIFGKACGPRLHFPKVLIADSDSGRKSDLRST